MKIVHHMQCRTSQIRTCVASSSVIATITLIELFTCQHIQIFTCQHIQIFTCQHIQIFTCQHVQIYAPFCKSSYRTCAHTESEKMFKDTEMLKR